jgi:hypothetical protein
VSNDLIKSYNDVRRRNRNMRDGTYAEVTQPETQSMFRTTFAKDLASGVDSEFFTQIGPIGTGISYAQVNGNLGIVAGTTANAELILRSTEYFNGPYVARWQCQLSQRIGNQNFVIELVDVLGDNCAVTINSATSITVNIPGSPFTSANVGQSVSVGAITGAAGIPGRYLIASVAGPLVNLTVSGWPASGTARCSVYGWNFHRTAYNGTTATNAAYDAGRRGYASTDTTATINTTGSPGHLGIMTYEDGMTSLQDQLVASSVGIATTQRASRVINVPDEIANLYLQIRCTNGTSNPASSTTWTVGMVSVSEYSAVNVAINSVRPQPANSAFSIGTINQVTSVASVSSANLSSPQISIDIPSASLTSTTTTAAITPGNGISYQVNIVVSAVTGTSPTLDVSIEESDDSGTSWFKVYDFARITNGVATYRSPIIPLTGNRVRYVQTVGGTSPNYTRIINRLQLSYPALVQRQLVDRTISLTTLNSATATLIARDAGNATQLIINVGAITTTAPALQLEGSEDFGATWFSIGSPLTAVASSTVQATNLSVNAALLRARVSTAGVGVTAGYVMIKAHD